jgi:predicted metal-dependent peptidase
MALTIDERMIRNRVILLRNQPFFGTLLINAHWRVDNDLIPTAGTDGQTLMINEHWMMALDDPKFQAVLLHEVLHMALEHVDRMKDVFEVDPLTANLAVDIVVNGIIRDNNLPLPEGGIWDDKLKHLSAREIYNILKQQMAKNPNYLKQKFGVGSGKGKGKGDGGDGKEVNVCLQKPKGEDNGNGGDQQQDDGDGEGESNQPPTKTNWKDVLSKASTIARMKKAGPVGAGMERIFKDLLEPTIDWRTVLYKYVTAAKTDFVGFDRRFISQGMYLDDLDGEKINVIAFIDTSGSVDEKLLAEFISELRFAVNSFPLVTGELWYFDTELYPQGDIMDIIGVPKLVGGGGTDFAPAMKHLAKAADLDSTCQTLGIMFTDGYASMTNWKDPETPLLWCICPGGVTDDTIPLGDVVRILR